MSYPYRPLDVARNEVRLIQVLPLGTLHKASHFLQKFIPGMVKCTMRHVSLDDWTEESRAFMTANNLDDFPAKAMTEKMSYQSLMEPNRIGRWNWGDFMTLSYNWGSPDIRRTILLDGFRIDVTVNLEEFLRQFRTEPGSEFCYIWIDALCIDQSNILERNIQVTRMASIYSKAYELRIWVGKEIDNTGLAIGHLKKWGIKLNSAEQQLAFMNVFRNHEEPFGDRATRLGIYDLLNRPYWNRLWIIQEIALSFRNIQIMCGSQRLSWNTMANALFLFALALKRLDALSRLDGVGRVDYVTRYHRIKRLRDASTINGIFPRLSHLISIAKGSAQQDEKDKIYGLMGIMDPAIAQAIRPSYSPSVSAVEVFVDFAKSHILSTRSLDILHAETLDPDEEDESYPSWAPHWLPDSSRNWVETGDILIDTPPYRTCGLLSTSAKFPRQNCLSVKGFRLDSIQTTARQPEDLDAAQKLTTTYGQQNRTPKSQIATSSPYQTEKEIRDALWRTLIGNRRITGNDSPPESYESLLHVPWPQDGYTNSDFLRYISKTIVGTEEYPIFLSYLERAQNCVIGGRELRNWFPTKIDSTYQFPDPNIVVHAIIQANIWLLDRNPMTTTQGYLGMFPQQTKSGDVVTILFGSSMPILLRPFGKNSYKLVGACYVHGVMDGEALKSLEDGNFVEEDFDIY